MTGKQDQIIQGFYRQHILAGVIIAGKQPIQIDTHGGGPGAEGSQIVATFGSQLMITLYDTVAATAYAQAWLAEADQWVFNGLPAEISVAHGQGSIGPAFSVRAHGDDRGKARYDSVSRAAIIRVGSLTWNVLDRAAARLNARRVAPHRPTGPGHPGPAGTRQDPQHSTEPPLTGTHPAAPLAPAPRGSAGCSVDLSTPEGFIHILVNRLDPDRARATPSKTRIPARPRGQEPIMYTITTTPGDRVNTAQTIPDALAVLATQLTAQLPDGRVDWRITDPAGTQHRGSCTLNTRIDQLAIAVDELVVEMYTALHRAADGDHTPARPPRSRSGGKGWPLAAPGDDDWTMHLGSGGSWALRSAIKDLMAKVGRIEVPA